MPAMARPSSDMTLDWSIRQSLLGGRVASDLADDYSPVEQIEDAIQAERL
jgi:hypothetical protein